MGLSLGPQQRGGHDRSRRNASRRCQRHKGERVNSESEVAALRPALEEVRRFGMVLNKGEREEIAYPKALWRLEYRGETRRPVRRVEGATRHGQSGRQRRERPGRLTERRKG